MKYYWLDHKFKEVIAKRTKNNLESKSLKPEDVSDLSSISLVNSILHYFKADHKYSYNKEILDFLEKYKFKNVVLLVIDGLGVYNLHLADIFSDDVKVMNTVYPPTTVAATSMLKTGLMPADINRLGWTMYSKKEDKVFVTFMGKTEEGIEIQNPEVKKEFSLIPYFTKERSPSSLDNFESHEVSPFGDIKALNLNEICNGIKNVIKSNSNYKFIYAYSPEPDSSMHTYGPKHEICRDKSRNFIEFIKNELTLENTCVFVTADHGHIDILPLCIKDYPSVCNLIVDNPTIIEQRTWSLFVKHMSSNRQDDLDNFKKEFNKYFESVYDLYTREEFIKSKVFGDVSPKSLSDETIGDFIACAKSDATIFINEEMCAKFKGAHAGATFEENLVPLITLYKK